MRRRLRFALEWIRWWADAPCWRDFYLCGRFQRQPFRIAIERWARREPRL